ncbi:hypothetical protein D187_000597 [Cystobacter fuscus DSM 2262]|uniref:Uncharacterized protein n=1 Tax=Cystobacter fuscus (strain ATCC 25194 / DSM 2262 / NBRC 100088 / M29) TaxID=1242864 RepID=S9PRN1_CYSF2|nr:hypothetical protein [Cystobacter fuscus]EPX65172.1 hypothetical protein D187_000597 [Cystobacter fuscus DSM 2262]
MDWWPFRYQIGPPVELMMPSWKRGLESSLLFAFFSRRVWLHSIGRYTSASS